MTITSYRTLPVSSPLPSDNCSRVDFVKATASQLRLRAVKRKHDDRKSDDDEKAQARLETLQDAIRTGNSRKAETALAAAKAAIEAQDKKPADDRATNEGDRAASTTESRVRFQAWA